MEKRNKAILAGAGTLALLAALAAKNCNEPEDKLVSEVVPSAKEEKKRTPHPKLGEQTLSADSTPKEISEFNKQWADRLLDCLNQKLDPENEGMICRKDEVTVTPDFARPDENEVFSQIHCEADGNQIHSYLQPICEDFRDPASCALQATSSIHNLNYITDTNVLIPELNQADPWGDLKLTGNNSRAFQPGNMETAVKLSCEDAVALYASIKDDSALSEIDALKREAHAWLSSGLSERGFVTTWDSEFSKVVISPKGSVQLFCDVNVSGNSAKWACETAGDHLNGTYTRELGSCDVSGAIGDESALNQLSTCVGIEHVVTPFDSLNDEASNICYDYMNIVKNNTITYTFHGETEEEREVEKAKYDELCDPVLGRMNR